MTKENILRHLNLILENDFNTLYRFNRPHEALEEEIEALKEAIEFIKQEPCEDAISRQAVLKIYNEWFNSCNIADKKENPKTQINALPPVTPQSKTGHWIIVDDCEKFIAKCSECGQIEDSRMINKYPYCHCGAKMEGEKV